MADIGILSWLNETSLQPYPFQKSFGLEGVFVDANFVQWDGFVPILQAIVVSDASVVLTILFDRGAQTLTISDFSTPFCIRIGTRYVGTLVFGDVAPLLSRYANQTITANVPFLAHLVKSVPSRAGVYSIDNKFGSLAFGHDANIWYDVTDNNVVFNAVSIGTPNTEPYLKTLNLVAPIANAVYIRESEIVHISSPTNNTLEFSLVGSGAADLVAASNETISTNPKP